MYLVLLHVNLCSVPAECTTHVFPCFLAFSSAKELCKAASAASAPAVAEEVEAFADTAFAELLAAFGLNLVGSNFTPRLAIHRVLGLVEVLLEGAIPGELEDDEFRELGVWKRSYVKGSGDVERC